MIAYDDRAAVLRNEPSNQANFFLISARHVPRNPHTVGMSQFRLAVVFPELLGGEDELAIGRDIAGIAIGLVKGINHERSLRLDRSRIGLAVEH